MPHKDIPSLKSIRLLQELQRILHVANVLWVPGVAVLVHKCLFNVLRMTRVHAEPVAYGCESCHMLQCGIVVRRSGLLED